MLWHPSYLNFPVGPQGPRVAPAFGRSSWPCSPARAPAADPPVSSGGVRNHLPSMGFNGIYTGLMGFSSDSMGYEWDFIVIQWNMNGIYPLVICYIDIAIENGYRNSGLSH